MNYTNEYIEKACSEYPLLKIQVEALKKQDGGLILKINEFAELVKEIATDNADLIQRNNKLKDLVDLIRIELIALRSSESDIEHIVKLIDRYNFEQLNN
ncbi:hypothetical protein [Clostridium intestinale]|uniref:Uncharacterized protein n=1 Tax=Clostridium intestinale TaxID=36845 RepID=A0A7D7AAZ4_9CLOT|nr:hypothetical protein [Clostridium intestinale]QLY78064.1 hypothetical protein HZF06_13275 [Clostridium intestinale]